MKRFLLLLLTAALFQYTFSQWTTNGTNIYNSNSGNVGIGTTSPQQKLHVYGGNIRVERTDLPGGGTIGFYATGFGDRSNISSNNNNDLIFNPVSYPNAMVINNGNGYVGIGTISPSTTLEVNGITRITSGSGNYIQLGAYSSSTDNFGYLSTGGQTNGTGLKFEVANGSSSAAGITAMTILNNTNVGIGTTSPGSKLEVAGEIKQTGRTTYLWGARSNQNQALMFAGWGIAHGGIYWYGNSKTFTINTGDDADMQGNYGNANLYVTGNLSIGTTPQNGYKLAVNGDAIFTKVKVKAYARLRFLPQLQALSIKRSRELHKTK